MRTVIKSNTEWDFFSFLSKWRKYADVLPGFSPEQEHFTHGMYQNIKPIMFYERINAKVFRHSIAFVIAVVVTSRSSSFEYTISVDAGAERNVCNTVVSTETPQTTTKPSQTLLPVYKLAHLSLPHSKSSPSRPPQSLAQPFYADALGM